MKKILVLIGLMVLLFAEYRFIMVNLRPSLHEGGELRIEVCGVVDSYYLE